MNFSQRVGLEPAVRPIQKNSMDQALRNSLWNDFDMLILNELRGYWRLAHKCRSRNPPNAALFVRLWRDFYKEDLATLPLLAERAAKIVHDLFFDSKTTPWNRVYDFVEFIGDLTGNLKENAAAFRTMCNYALERESSAYRFVGKIIAPITNEAEIKAIELAAAHDNNPLRPVSTHIETALKILSDRKTKPDYRNSMKESISAVEALAKIIAPNAKTLGPALDAVTAKIRMHPQLRDGIKALYGYSNDDHGIRHALKDDGLPEEEDARFFLVACSAFVNYLSEKARKNGLLA